MTIVFLNRGIGPTKVEAERTKGAEEWATSAEGVKAINDAQVNS